ncbi:MAG: CHASE3 domain-containing protein [Verrucomicrobia bacterium]|nr:CHASE3 domain-containing protein [Verrucomicrobiota bacterium]
MSLSASYYNRKVLLAVVIIVPLVVAGVFYLVSLELSADQERAMQALRRTNEVIARVNDLSRSLHEAESGARGYLLTGDPLYLTHVRYARLQSLILLPYLERLMQDDLLQSQRLVELRTAIHDKFADVEQLIGLVETRRRDDAVRLFNEHAGLKKMRSIRATLDVIGDEEQKVLAAGRKAVRTKMTVRENLFTALLFLAASVVVGAGILALRVQQLQGIITICAWTQRVNYKGRWMRMEEFLWERFRVRVSHGISEEAFDGVMGIVGKNLTVSDHRGDRAAEVKHDDGRQTTRWG